MCRLWYNGKIQRTPNSLGTPAFKYKSIWIGNSVTNLDIFLATSRKYCINYGHFIKDFRHIHAQKYFECDILKIYIVYIFKINTLISDNVISGFLREILIIHSKKNKCVDFHIKTGIHMIQNRIVYMSNMVRKLPKYTHNV